MKKSNRGCCVEHLRLAKIETLEARCLCSVSAATLAGPLTIGSTWQYSGGTTVSVGGPSIHSDSLQIFYARSFTSTLEGTQTISTSNFEALDPKGGLLQYGYSVYDPVDLYANTVLYTPYETLFPSEMVAGQQYTTQFQTTSLGPDGAGDSTGSDTISLVSEQLQRVTVPAGTFSAYEINDTNSGTEWIAPGVGVVKGPLGELTSYQIAGDPTKAQLVPDIVSSSVPDGVVSGGNLNAVVGVEVKNLGVAAETGQMTTQVYAVDTPGGAIDSSAVLLASVTQNASLFPNDGMKVDVTITSIPSGLSGYYSLVARTTDSLGNSQTTYYEGNSFTIIPDYASLVPSILSSSVPSNLVSGTNLHGSMWVEVQNEGGAAEHGRVTTQVYASSSIDGTIDSSSVLLGSATRKLSLRPNHSARMKLRISNKGSGLNDSYSSYLLVVRTTDSQGRSQTAVGDSITVAPPFVSLDTFFVSAKAPHSINGSGFCVVSVTNHGNVRSAVTGTIELFIPGSNESNLFEGATVLATRKVRFNLAPGTTRKYVLRFGKAVVKAITTQSWIAVGVVGDGAGRVDEFAAPFSIAN